MEIAMADKHDQMRAQAKRASIVILVAFAAWFALSAIGGSLGLPVGLALALDGACLVALGWAMWTLVRAWRAIREEE